MVGRGANITTGWLVVGLTYPLCKQSNVQEGPVVDWDKVEKVLECKIPCKKTCGKTTTEME
jgi:hypothetical protein